jgi:hypothetical protein
VIRARRALIAGMAGAGVLACNHDYASFLGADPCAAAGTCVRLEVDSSVIHTIDQLELDVVYAGHHATITTGTVGTTIELPFSFPLKLNLPGSPLIDVDLVLAGKLGGRVIGADAGSTTVQQGYHASVFFLLGPIDPCSEGTLYCGGIPGVFADTRSLYRCTGGVPIFYTECSSGCTDRRDEGGLCYGLGLCRDGGTYCGGHVLDGDPNTLYACHSFKGSVVMQCPAGCVVRGDGDDACR